MARLPLLFALCWPVAAAAAPVPAQLVVGSSATRDFRALDNVEGSFVDLGLAPFRAMAVTPDGLTLFAVNTHGSRVLRFDDLTGAPTATFDVPWGPVSVAYWESNVDGHAEVLVVTRGTYGLTRLDPATGEVLGYLPLPPEPADILVDEATDRAWVSCSARDEVVEIDLVANAIDHTYQMTSSRHLAFLSFDGDGHVLVAPMLSGNNTVARRSPIILPEQADVEGFIADLYDPTVATEDLPDHDLFRIRTDVSGLPAEVVGAGTNLFAHAYNPVTEDVWLLNTEADNANPAKQNEPALNGTFLFDRVTRIGLPPVGGAPSGRDDHAYVWLDDADPATAGVQFGDVLGKPYHLDVSSSGHVYVVGALTDNVRILTPAGGTAASWDLPDGSIPRGISYVEQLGLVLVYNWGRNTVGVYNLLLPGIPLVVELDLGYDPTPERRRLGRELFYDGDNSLHGHVSCESCHLEGGTDLLAWNLSDWPYDDKGPMETQLLRGIEETRPYHWRGERPELVDFNGAFAGLLGGSELDDASFAAFEDYVFHLRNPANPFEHPDRVVTDDVTVTQYVSFLAPPAAPLSATAGQETYFSVPNVGASTCNDCHQLPTGTGNDFFQDGFFDQSHRSGFVVPAYNGMWRKFQPERHTLTWADGSQEVRPPLGQGVSHAGLKNGLEEFVNDLFPPLSVQERRNVAFFVHQVDSGLAPYVHEARLLDQDTFDETQRWILDRLIPQVVAGHVDVALFGTVTAPNGTTHQVRWYLDRDLARFVAEDGIIPPKRLTFFFQQASTGQARVLVQALPRHMHRRWGVDLDGDGLFDGDEVRQGTDPATFDSDRDGFADGTEVAAGSSPTDPTSLPIDTTPPRIVELRQTYVTARVLKLVVRTDELSQAFVTCQGAGLPRASADSLELDTHHTLFVRHLEPSNTATSTVNTYDCTINVVDEAGNRAAQVHGGVETEPFVFAADAGTPNESVTQYLDLTYVGPDPAGGHVFAFETLLDHRRTGVPLADHVAVVRPVLNGERAAAVEVGGVAAPDLMMHEASGAIGFYIGIGPFAPGSITGPDGISTGMFTLPDALSGDVVEVAIETAGEVLPAFYDPSVPSFLISSLYDFPNSPPEGRVSPGVLVP
jgi:streptogramin lyase